MEPKAVTFKRQPQELKELLSQARMPSLIQSPAKAARFFETLFLATGISSSQLARQMDISPQTVNRWRRGEVTPRPRQFEKIAEYMERILDEDQNNPYRKTEVGNAGQEHPEAVGKLGIHFADSIMALESEAHHVWILMSGALREANRGFIGESVLRALKSGVSYHYVFLAGTTAESSFTQLTAWLQSETFAGSVTGYCLRDSTWASTLGITQVLGAWIVIEYSDAQIQRLHRRFDVFMALPVREYADAAHLHVKNEDGQPCWIELATSRAGIWIDRLHDLRGFKPSHKKSAIEVTQVTGKRGTSF